jgi:hypothetical protein
MYGTCIRGVVHESEPNTLNHFKDNFRLTFSSKFYMIIGAYYLVNKAHYSDLKKTALFCTSGF